MKLPLINTPMRFISARRRTVAIVIGLALAALSVYYTWTVSVEMKHEDEAAVEQLRRDERNAVAMWEDILRSTNIGGYGYNQELLNKLAQHTNVPLAITDERLNIFVTNLPDEIAYDREALRKEIMEMSRKNKPISVSHRITQQTTYTIYYGTTNYEELISSAHS